MIERIVIVRVIVIVIGIGIGIGHWSLTVVALDINCTEHITDDRP
jgi:hypothetical protein